MNALHTTVKVQLDKERHLSYPFNALVSFEDETGEDLLMVFDRMSTGTRPNMKTLRALVWCGLLHEDPTLTPDRVGEMLSFRSFSELAPAMAEAIMLSLPEAKADAGNPRKAPATVQKRNLSTGASSGA